MQIDLFKRIEENMPRLSKGHKAIGEFIINYYDKAAYMTAAKLGVTVGVSESTVVRFAAEIGFEGYPELQREMKDLLKNKLTSFQRIEVTNDLIGNDDVLEKVMMQDVERIKKTLEVTSREDFNKAVDIISNADNIYIIGTRSAASLAGFLSHYFNLIFSKVKLINTTSESELFEQIMRIDQKDVIIGISFPRYSKQTTMALQYAKSNKTKTIAITDSIDAPTAKYADSILVAKSDMASFVDSLVAPLSLINSLIVALSIVNKEKLFTNFEKLENVWEEYQVYEKFEENKE